MSVNRTRKPESLSVVCMPTGIAYSDRNREVHGDYKRIAYLFFSDLSLDVKAPKSGLLPEIIEHVAQMRKKAGTEYPVSACGQTVLLGGGR